MASEEKTAQQILQDKGGDLYTVAGESMVLEALRIMVESKVGSVLIKEGTHVVGIYTERDLMRNTIDPDFDPASNTDLAGHDPGAALFDTAFELMDKFFGLRLRHLLIEQDGEFIGLLSIGDVVRSALRQRTRELEELQQVANWEYYAEWKPRQ